MSAPRARLAEGVAVELDDLDAEPVGEGVGVRGRAERLGEDGRDAGGLDGVAELLELARAGLGQRAGRRQHAAEDLEPVAVGEVAEGVVVGDEHAVAVGDDGQRRRELLVERGEVGLRPSPRTRRRSPGRRRRRRAHRRAPAGTARSATMAGRGRSRSSRARRRRGVSTWSPTAEHRHAAVGDGVERVGRASPPARARWRRRASRRRAPRGPAATARTSGGRRRRARSCGCRGCRRRPPGRRCRPRCPSWRRRSRRRRRAAGRGRRRRRRHRRRSRRRQQQRRRRAASAADRI